MAVAIFLEVLRAGFAAATILRLCVEQSPLSSRSCSYFPSQLGTTDHDRDRHERQRLLTDGASLCVTLTSC